jgi:hypothetical protein
MRGPQAHLLLVLSIHSAAYQIEPSGRSPSLPPESYRLPFRWVGETIGCLPAKKHHSAESSRARRTSQPGVGATVILRGFRAFRSSGVPEGSCPCTSPRDKIHTQSQGEPRPRRERTDGMYYCGETNLYCELTTQPAVYKALLVPIGNPFVYNCLILKAHHPMAKLPDCVVSFRVSR